MPTQTTNLFLLEDLEDVGRTSELAKSDRDALQAVAEWIKTFVVKPHKDPGRPGPVCPFVPGALERKTFWLAPERIGALDVPAVVNSNFRPFRSPVPFLFVRHGVISDWKFFLDKKDWLSLWARRFGESAVHALAEELRHLPWREQPVLDEATALVQSGASPRRPHR